MNLADSHILIVDDDLINMLLLQRLFSNVKQISTAKNGRECLSFLEDGQESLPDLILLDIMMPDMSGLDVLKLIRQQYSRVELPIILISALSTSRDITLGLQMGANDYIAKPFDVDIVRIRASSQIEIKYLHDEKRRATVALEQSNIVKQRLMQIVSHDLRNPLNTIALAHELIRTSVEEHPDLIEILNTAVDSAQLIDEIIAEFMEMDAFEGDGRFQLVMRPHNAQEMIHLIMQNYHLQAQHKNVTFHFDESDAVILADFRRLRQALHNLLSNAIKYTPPFTTIYLSVVKTDTYADIHIIDQGRGIPVEDVPRLFEPFANINTKPTNGEKSTGLGLWIVKQMMQAQGGDVGYTPHPNGGADFWIRLYLSTVAATA